MWASVRKLEAGKKPECKIVILFDFATLHLGIRWIATHEQT